MEFLARILGGIKEFVMSQSAFFIRLFSGNIASVTVNLGSVEEPYVGIVILHSGV